MSVKKRTFACRRSHTFFSQIFWTWDLPIKEASRPGEERKLFPNKYMRLDLPLAVCLVLIQFDGASR
jgi:hypothetical protein